jgi:MFS family permease
MRPQNTRPSLSVLGILAACMALVMTGFAMFIPLFALRFESFGAGVEALSTSDMAYAFTFAFAAPPIGMLADRFGRRPVLLLSLTGYLLVFAGYSAAAAAWSLVLLRGVAGVFAAGLLPGMTSIVGDLAPADRRARWIGIVTGGAAVGYIAGPSLGGVLYDRFGYGAPCGVAVGMAAAALLLAALLVHETHTPATQPDALLSGWRRGWQSSSARSTLFLVMVVTFGVMFAFAFVQPQLMFYVYDDLGWTSSQLGLSLSAYGAAFMMCAFTLAQLSDRVGRKPVLVLGLILFSAQFVGPVIFRQLAWIMASFIIAGLGNALYDPALSAILLDVAPPTYMASMLGIKSTAGSLGSMLGPAVLVLLASAMSPKIGFLLAAGLVAVLALISELALHLPGRDALTSQARQGSLKEMGTQHHTSP